MRLDDLELANLSTSETTLRWLDFEGCQSLTVRTKRRFASLPGEFRLRLSGCLGSLRLSLVLLFMRQI